MNLPNIYSHPLLDLSDSDSMRNCPFSSYSYLRVMNHPYLVAWLGMPLSITDMLGAAQTHRRGLPRVLRP
jgi:hypothetical protein